MSKDPIYKFSTVINFGDTDAGGRIYFPMVFDLSHRALETWAVKEGIFERWFKNLEWGTPIRHAEADYFKPLEVGDEVDVLVIPEKCGESSLTWKFNFMKADTLMASVQIVSVNIDLKTSVKKAVPEELAKYF